MLIRPDATWTDPVTGHKERIFPLDVRSQVFESVLPAAEVFKNTVLDPSIGLDDPLGVQTFARAQLGNYISTIKSSVFDISTRLGISENLQNIPQKVGSIYTQIQQAFEILDRNHGNPLAAGAEIAKNAAFQTLALIAAYGGYPGMVIAAIGAAALWAGDLVASSISTSLQKDVALPPLQSIDPSTDAWQVNRVYELIRGAGEGGVVFPDGGVEPASNANYTALFAPAYEHTKPWTYQHREKGLAAQQGTATQTRGPGDVSVKSPFRPSSGAFGFMPGTRTMLRVLQSSYRYYYATRASVGVDRYALYCRGLDKPCYQTQKTFDGTKDCRQCVDSQSVWPTEGIGWAYAGAPLNATTPGENVGEFYPSTNELINFILEQISQEGPLLYTLDTETVYYAWQQTFERFWEFAHAQWGVHDGYGWRGQISRLATLMVAYEEGEELRLGGRYPGMPLELIADPRSTKFSIPLEKSIWHQLIAPYCVDLGKLQKYYLDTLNVAYIPPGSGALYTASGTIRNNDLGKSFLDARRALLFSSKRHSVQLWRVTDPEYRAELVNSGVKESPVKQSLQKSPGMILSPTATRPPPRPVGAKLPPLSGTAAMGAAGAVDLILEPEITRAPTGKKKPRPKTFWEEHRAELAIAASAALVGGGAIAYQRRKKKRR